MATEVLLETLAGCEDLPYVGTACKAVNAVVGMVQNSESVRAACTEEFPEELQRLQIILSLLPERIGVVDGSEKTLCDGTLARLTRHVEAMEETVDTFNREKTNCCWSLLTAKSNKSRIDSLNTSLAKIKQDLSLLLGIFNGDNRDAGRRRGDAYSFSQLLAQAREVDREAEKSRRKVEHMNRLEGLYEQNARPCMDMLRYLKNRMGSRYPVAAIIPPVLVTDEERNAMFASMRTLCTFWRDIQALYKDKTNIFEGSKSWAGRGKEYRMLCEPIDILNWYYGDKNLQDGHYIDGISENDELVDNHKRPGRYKLLQEMEIEVLERTPESSLGTARELKELLNDQSWKTLANADGPYA